MSELLTMQGLVQADGDFDQVADIIEGLEKLPPDWKPKSKPEEGLFVLFITKPSEEDSRAGWIDCHIESADKFRDWCSNMGYYIALETPPLPNEVTCRYIDALLTMPNWESGAIEWLT